MFQRRSSQPYRRRCYIGTGTLERLFTSKDNPKTFQQGNSLRNHKMMEHAPEEIDRRQRLEGVRFRQRAIELMTIKHDTVPTIASFFPKKASDIVQFSRTGALQQEANNKTESVLSGMAPFVLLAQCFSLLGVSGRNPLKSPRMLLSLVVSSLLAMHAILAAGYFVSLPGTTRNFTHTTFMVFYTNGFLMSCLFMRLGTRWEGLCTAFEDVEKKVSFYGNSRGVRRKMKIITAVYILLVTAERILGGVRNHSNIIKSNILTGSNISVQEWFQKYYFSKFPYMAVHISFPPILVVGAMLTNFLSALIHTYNDLLIMLMGIAISSQFWILNNRLITSLNEIKDPRSWKQLRETYNALCVLVRTVDQCISWHVLISFLNNLFFICLQMLRTVRQDATSLYETIFIYFSAVLMLSRMVGVSIFAASIYDESRAIKPMLFSVSSEKYCVEVKRLIDQATYDQVALTGCNFFSVTRSLLLAVLGTIATYEVVLVQINEVNSKSWEDF